MMAKEAHQLSRQATSVMSRSGATMVVLRCTVLLRGRGTVTLLWLLLVLLALLRLAAEE